MNNYYYNMPLDSLGRKVGKARGFGRYTNDMLKSLKADLGLFMELDTLIFLRDYYKSNKTDGMLLEELYLFDAIVKGAQEMTANALIGDF